MDQNFECCLKRIIREKFSETGQIGLNALLDSLSKDQEQIFKDIISLIRQGKLVAIFKKWEGEQVFFRIIPSKKGKEKNFHQDIRDCIVTVRLCSLLLHIKDIPSFLRLTGSNFSKVVLLQFLQKSKASFDDLHFLCCYLDSFFSGEIPYSLMDLGLEPEKVLSVLNKVYLNKFIPQQQELITMALEKGSITLESLPSERLVKLLRNESIEVIQPDKRTSKGLYWELQHHALPEVPLYFNRSETTFFELFCRFIAAPQKTKQSLTLLLYGLPGTGKTEFVHQVAKICKVEIMQMNFSEIHSKWVGETEKNIAKVFEAYAKKRIQSKSPIILLINEADGLMSKRVEVSTSNDAFHNQVQTKMLEELDRFEGILVATTNLKHHLDPAFFRRFLFCQQISIPDTQTRSRILDDSIKLGSLPAAAKPLLQQLSWSPAQLRNIERKIRQFEFMDLLDPELIQWLFDQEGILSQGGNLGFAQKKSLESCHKRRMPEIIL
jgi:hypothetical protein